MGRRWGSEPATPVGASGGEPIAGELEFVEDFRGGRDGESGGGAAELCGRSCAAAKTAAWYAATALTKHSGG